MTTTADHIVALLRPAAPANQFLQAEVDLIDQLAASWDRRRAPPAPAPIAKIGLSPQDFAAAASRLGCTVAQIRAVDELESNGSGFLPDGRPRILFEAHKFDEFTGGRFRASHPGLSSQRWNKKLYVGGAREWNRLNQAIALDAVAALKSASAGRYQIMGFNFALADFESVEAFWVAMKRSERDHLDAFCAFIESKRLQDELRQISNVHAACIPFARGYNGEGFDRNSYHIKLARAHSKWNAR